MSYNRRSYCRDQFIPDTRNQQRHHSFHVHNIYFATPNLNEGLFNLYKRVKALQTFNNRH